MDRMDTTQAEEETRAPQELLETIRNYMRDPQASTQQFLISLGGASVLFQLVAANPEEDLILSTLDRVCRSDYGLELLTDDLNMSYLLMGLNSENEELIIVTLKTLSHLFLHPAGVRRLLEADVFSTVLKLLAADSIAVAHDAEAFLAVLCSSPAGVSVLFSSDSLALLHGMLDLSETVSFRVLSLCVRVGTSSPEAFTAFEQTGPLARLFSRFANPKVDDILALLNVMELVGQLIDSEHGLAYAVRHDFVSQLSTLLVTRHQFAAAEAKHQRAQQANLANGQASGRTTKAAPYSLSDAVPSLDTMTVHLFVGCLRLMEQIAVAATKFNDFSYLSSPSLSRVLELSLSTDEPQVEASAISATCSIASTPHGLLALVGIDPSESSSLSVEEKQHEEEKLQQVVARSVLAKVVDFVTSSGDLRKLAAMHGLASVFSILPPALPQGSTSSPHAYLTTTAGPSTSPVFLQENPLVPPKESSPSSAASHWSALPPSVLQRAQSLQYCVFKLARDSEALESCFPHLARPFEDLRLAVFRLMFELVRHSWGWQFFVERAGNVEHILDRRTETTKFGAEWKYRIIKRLVLSPMFAQSQSLSRTHREGLQEYVKQGPFYSKAEAQVLVKSEAE